MTASNPTTGVEAALWVSRAAELASRYYPNGRLGGLAVDGECPGPLGSPVTLRVHVEHPARSFDIKGVLAWARHTSARQPPGFGVDFTSDEEGTRVRLLAFARDQVGPEAVRAAPRFEVNLPAELVVEPDRARATVVDLSVGGAFLRMAAPPPVGAAIKLKVRLPGALLAARLEGSVAWQRTGADAGCGVHFTAGPRTLKQLSRAITRLVFERHGKGSR